MLFSQCSVLLGECVCQLNAYCRPIWVLGMWEGGGGFAPSPRRAMPLDTTCAGQLRWTMDTTGHYSGTCIPQTSCAHPTSKLWLRYCSQNVSIKHNRPSPIIFGHACNVWSTSRSRGGGEGSASSYAHGHRN